MTKTCGLLAAAALLAHADAASAAPAKLVRAGDAATPGQQAFMSTRFWRLRAAAPLGWSANTWVTQHAFGLDARRRRRPPEWRLLDNTRPAGLRRLARRRRLSGTRRSAHGGSPRRRPPSRSATAGCSSTTSSWSALHHPRGRLAHADRPAHRADDDRGELAEADGRLHGRRPRRAADTEIVHDVLWYKGDAGDVLRELQAANAVTLDKGFNDTTIVAGRRPTATRRSRAGSSASRRAAAPSCWTRRRRTTPPLACTASRLPAGRQRRCRDRQRRRDRPGRLLGGLQRRPRRAAGRRGTRGRTCGAATTRAASCSSTSPTAAPAR